MVIWYSLGYGTVWVVASLGSGSLGYGRIWVTVQSGLWQVWVKDSLGSGSLGYGNSGLRQSGLCRSTKTLASNSIQLRLVHSEAGNQ